MSVETSGCWRFVLLYIICVSFQSRETNGFEKECVPDQIERVDAIEYPSGNLYSPGRKSEKMYPNSVRCGFQIKASARMKIKLKFNLIDIQQNKRCLEDHVLIINMNYSNPENYLTVAGLYCSAVEVPDLITATNEAQIRFLSGLFGSARGFNITYNVVSSSEICLRGQFMCRNRKCFPNQDSICNGDDECGDGTDEENCELPPVVSKKCGTPDVQPGNSSDVLDRIVGGFEAVRGSWPWQVDLQAAALWPNGHFCGGTLLTTEWFISAAHCFQGNRKPYEIRVHVGNHHRYKKDPYEQIRYVKEYYVYGVNMNEFLINGKYDIVHDLAIAKLNAPVYISPHVQPACLPELNEELKVGQPCYATGWGRTRGSGGTDVLKQAMHPIQNERKCKNAFQNFVNNTMICAGRLEKGFGLCHGDSGGPLVCKKDDKWTVYGAASFVTDSNLISGLCGIPNRPTVFNKVSVKMNWINAIIQNN